MRELLDASGDITDFLGSWYGPPDRPAEAEHPDAERLPAALRAWYRITSRYSKPVLFNHKVVPVDQLGLDEGLLAFCTDDFEWQGFGVAPTTAEDGDNGDPLVHRRLLDGDAGWEPNDQGLRLSQFLPAVLLHETVHGARFTASADQLTIGQCEQLLAPLRRLDGPELFTAQYAAGHQLLAAAWPEGESWSVRLAARTESLLRHAEAVPGVRFGVGEWYPGEGLSLDGVLTTGQAAVPPA